MGKLKGELNRLNRFIKSQPLIFLTPILFLAIFFRYYQITDRFYFNHDSDLYSWIVKDIVVNGHWRSIGQLTSTPGIFIGPIFYYLLIPFFLITSMDPIGAIGLIGIVGIAGVLSYYFIFKNLFNQLTGLTAAFLEAVILWRVNHDRWIVPTMFTTLWEIWYFYVLFNLIKGNFNVLPILGLLIGLIWHINFSFAPVLFAAPLAILLSRKMPKFSDFGKTFIAFIIPSLPLIFFEIRHNFSQTKSFLSSFTTDQLGGTGFPKFLHILDQISGNAIAIFAAPYRNWFFPTRYFLIVFFILLAYLLYKKIISKSLALILLIWIIAVVGYFTFSSKIISEYYFSSLETIFLAMVIIFIALLSKLSWVGKVLYIVILAVILSWNIYNLVFTENSYDHRGYKERNIVIKYIVNDAKQNNFPCIAISYITPPGSNLGFRYLFYLTDFPINNPDKKFPVYTIVTPADLYADSVVFKYGSYAIIPPDKNFKNPNLVNDCLNRNDNLTDSLFGYTQ